MDIPDGSVEFGNDVDEDNVQVEILELLEDGNYDEESLDPPSSTPTTTQWSATQIDSLLQHRFQMHALFESSETKKNQLWNRIAAQMLTTTGDSGDDATPAPPTAVACSSKFKNMCNTYRTIKGRAEHVDPTGRSTFRGTKWPYYAQFDRVYGQVAATPRRSRSYFYEFCSDVLKTFPEPPRRERPSRRVPRTPDPVRREPLHWRSAMVEALVRLRLQRHAAFGASTVREHHLLWRQIAVEVRQQCGLALAGDDGVYGGECYRKYRLLLKAYRRHRAVRDAAQQAEGGGGGGGNVAITTWRFWDQFHAVYGDEVSDVGAGTLHEMDSIEQSPCEERCEQTNDDDVAGVVVSANETCQVGRRVETESRQTPNRPPRRPTTLDRLRFRLERERFRNERQHAAAMVRVRHRQVCALERIAAALEQRG